MSGRHPFPPQKSKSANYKAVYGSSTKYCGASTYTAAPALSYRHRTSVTLIIKHSMPRNRGTSRKGKPKKEMRSAGFGKALERCVYISSFVLFLNLIYICSGKSKTVIAQSAVKKRERMRNAYTFHFDLKILEEYYSVVLTFSLLDTWSTINFAYRCGRKKRRRNEKFVFSESYEYMRMMHYISVVLTFCTAAICAMLICWLQLI